MRSIVFILVTLALAPPAIAGKVYRCVENGAVSFSDQPCASGSDQEVLEVPSAQVESSVDHADEDAPLAERIVGRWRWTGESGGSEVRTFQAGGRFSSSSDDDFAKTTGRGSWELEGSTLTIRGTFKNIHSSGDEMTVSNVMTYSVESVDQEQMVLHWDRYDSTSRWERL